MALAILAVSKMMKSAKAKEGWGLKNRETDWGRAVFLLAGWAEFISRADVSRKVLVTRI